MGFYTKYYLSNIGMLESRKLYFLLYVGDVIKLKLFPDHEKKRLSYLFTTHLYTYSWQIYITMLLLITISKVSPYIFNHHFAMTSPLISTKPVRVTSYTWKFIKCYQNNNRVDKDCYQ